MMCPFVQNHLPVRWLGHSKMDYCVIDYLDSQSKLMITSPEEVGPCEEIDGLFLRRDGAASNFGIQMIREVIR